MPLSEQEKRTLEQLEAQLAADDPRLASLLVADPHRAQQRRHLVFGGLLAACGVVLLVVAASSHLTAVGVLGFVLIALGVAYAFVDAPRPVHASAPRATNAVPRGLPGLSVGAAPAGPARQSSFMTTMEQRWERRRRQSQGW